MPLRLGPRSGLNWTGIILAVTCGLVSSAYIFQPLLVEISQIKKQKLAKDKEDKDKEASPSPST